MVIHKTITRDKSSVLNVVIIITQPNAESQKMKHIGVLTVMGNTHPTGMDALSIKTNE